MYKVVKHTSCPIRSRMHEQIWENSNHKENYLRYGPSTLHNYCGIDRGVSVFSIEKISALEVIKRRSSCIGYSASYLISSF